MNKAIVLLSGGLDSATAAICAKEEDHFDLLALTFKYGQKHSCEVEAACKVAKFLEVDIRVYSLEQLGIFRAMSTKTALISNSSLTVPKSSVSKEVPVTYVPCRNLIFLSLACGLAEALDIRDIYTGMNAVDYSGYPDCRPEFVDSFTKTVNLGTKAGVEGDTFSIHTPLIDMTKAEIIRKGTDLGMDYSLTHSCYDPDVLGKACGKCDSCLIRKRGFEEAGVKDLTVFI